MNEGISAILGIIMPILTQLINQRINFADAITTKRVKQAIAIIISFVVGILVAYFTKQFDFANIMASIGIVYTLSNVAYKQYFQPTFGKKGIRNYMNE